MARPPNPGLSEQQQRVLELMADGRTNAQIADALGITLDGAKYNVREVFDKLGVSSREEAVAAWRAGRPSMWQRLRGLLWPAGAVLAGAGVAAVAVIAVAVIQSDKGSRARDAATTADIAAASTVAESAPTLPADWQLWTAIVTEDDEPGTETTSLSVMTQAEHGALTTKFTVQGHFGPVAWSPDGSALAIVSKSAGASGQLTIYGRADWKSRSFPLRDAPVSVIWSPDGKYLAALGRGLAIYRPDGTLVGEYMPSTNTGESSNGLVWSPGSGAVDAIINDELRVVTVKGDVSSLKPPADLDFTSAIPWAWNDDSTPVVVGIVGTPTANPQSSVAYSVHLTSAPAEWTKQAIQATGVMRPLSDAVRAASTTAPKGTLDLAAVTADGAFGIVALFERVGEGNQYHWTITAYAGHALFATLDFGISDGLPPNDYFAAVVTSGSG